MQAKMLLYIHGFASSANSFKTELLNSYFKDVNSITLSYEPKIAISQLEKFISQHQNKKITLIGTSLGAFYALYLSNKYQLDAVLINPATEPWNTLKRYENQEVLNYSSGKSFYFTSAYLHQLKSYQVQNIDETKLLLLLQTGDTLLDYTKALKLLANTQTVITDGGSHRFENFENYFETITDFIHRNK
jgi:hypothetical protein